MNNYDIIEVLPHRAPMVLIDQLDKYDKVSASCSVTIQENSPFYDAQHQGVASYIGNEYMAQAIAAYSGAHALDEQGTVTIGFLLGSRKYKTFQPYFRLGEKYLITINELYKEESGLSVFDCEIIDAKNNIVAKANVNVFQPKDVESFLQK